DRAGHRGELLLAHPAPGPGDGPLPAGLGRERRADVSGSARRRALKWGGTLAAALLVGELIARHYISGSLDMVRHTSDPQLIYELVPGHYVSDGYYLRSDVVEYTVDERGCRVTPGAPPPAGPKVLFLGSSIVFGIAVKAESALPEAARRGLHEQ